MNTGAEINFGPHTAREIDACPPVPEAWYLRFPQSHPRLCAAAISVFIAAWFLAHARKGVRAYFSPDDMMNLYFAIQVHVGRLAFENIFPFTTGYRPLGTAFYRIAFALFGMNPIPFRIGVYIVMMVNVALLYRVARKLSGSIEIGVLSALLYSFHPGFTGLYLNGGTVYDVLCACFYFATLDYYISVRESNDSLRGRQWIIFYFLTVAALNSKEAAATLPALLLVYEIVFHEPARRVMRAVWVAGIISAGTIAARMHEGSPLIHNAGYALHLGVRQFFRSSVGFLQALFLLPDDTLGIASVTALFLLVFAIAFASRSKCLQFCAFLALLAPLPVNFINQRGLYAIYIAVGGWAIYLSALCVNLRDWLYSRLWNRPALSPTALEPERLITFLLAVVLLSAAYGTAPPIRWSEMGRDHSDLYRLHADLLRLQPKVTPGSKALFLNDTFPAEEWMPLFVYGLTYRDTSLQIDRAKKMPTHPDEAGYQYIYDYKDGHLIRVKPAS
jgi:hypothetical protein